MTTMKKNKSNSSLYKQAYKEGLASLAPEYGKVMHTVNQFISDHFIRIHDPAVIKKMNTLPMTAHRRYVEIQTYINHLADISATPAISSDELMSIVTCYFIATEYWIFVGDFLEHFPEDTHRYFEQRERYDELFGPIGQVLSDFDILEAR
jgi:hypothetical protein